MRRTYLCSAIAVGSLSLLGCQSSPLDGAGTTSLPQARPLAADLQTFQPSTDPDAASNPPTVPDPTGPLTLRQAMALALARSPELASFSWQVRAAEARTLQASLPSNPELDLEFENFAGSGDMSGTDSLETTISISQTIPLGSDLTHQRSLAQQQAKLRGWDYEAARLELLTTVTERFVTALAAQRRVELAQEAVDLAQQVHDAINRLVEAGSAPALQLSRSGVELATADIELGRAKRELEAARLQLSLTWAESTPAFTELTADFDRVQSLPAAASLVVLINQNPQVARWATEITAARAEKALAKAQAMPDITASLGYRQFNESDDGALVAGVSLPLPLFDRNQGASREADFNIRAAQQEQHAATLRIEGQLSQAYQSLAAAHDEVTALRQRALPAAQQAFDATHRAFEQGNVNYLDVLDVERTLVELRSQHLDALVAYHSAVFQIEGLIGQPLDTVPSLVTTTEPAADNGDHDQ